MKYLSISVLVACSLMAMAQTAETQYADILVDSYYSQANKNYDDFYGGTTRAFPVLITPEVVLGANETYFVSLPEKSYVTVQFTDNQIIDFPDQDDIFITELGCSGEKAEVFVSSDGKRFIRLGIVDDCRVSSLDLAAINFKAVVHFVKVVGIGNAGGSPGFDLVNIKGLPNANIESYTDISAISDYFNNPEGKKIILENVYFASNRFELNDDSKHSLDALLRQLKMHPNVSIKIVGHTDDVGDEQSNLDLSANRANAVREFLVKSGISDNRIVSEGKGETQPIKSNGSDDGRKTNRRVEFEIVEN
ncbi:hypothetical protein FLLO111716_09345 [Flavobacterium longum]|uniref:OmpA family protein n=1 Tax=Flavobacterium longum TaxID=1299340 RepID=UPI0039E9B6EC